MVNVPISHLRERTKMAKAVQKLIAEMYFSKTPLTWFTEPHPDRYMNDFKIITQTSWDQIKL